MPYFKFKCKKTNLYVTQQIHIIAITIEVLCVKSSAAYATTGLRSNNAKKGKKKNTCELFEHMNNTLIYIKLRPFGSN